MTAAALPRPRPDWPVVALLVTVLHLLFFLSVSFRPPAVEALTRAGAVMEISLDLAPAATPAEAQPSRPEPPQDVAPAPAVEPALATAEATPAPAPTAAAEASPEPAAVAAPVPMPVPAAPVSAPSADTQAGRQARDNYFGRLKQHLDRQKRYPVQARKEKQQGTVTVTFTLDRRGELLAASLTRSSGHPLLDEAALALLRRAAPLPPLPEAMPGPSLSVTLPIDYSLITR